MTPILPVPPQKLCSPLKRCFPPKPTICLICNNTSAENCPMKQKR